MSRQLSLKTTVKRFEERLASSEDLFRIVYPVAHGDNAPVEGSLTQSQSSRVVSLAFLQMVTAWEDFLQCVFLRYMLDAPSPSGYKPKLLKPVLKTLDLAFALLCNNPKQTYLSWSGPDEVKKGRNHILKMVDHFALRAAI